MKAQSTIIFLALLLAACVPSQTIPVDAQNTAMAIVETGIALTQTAMPTATPTNAPTALPTATPQATPIPTQPPFPVLTPDAIQVERWREYQIALAKKLVSKFPIEIVLCEWEILGQAEQELYVWAVCVAPGYEASRPAAIYLKTDGSIQNVEVPLYGSTWDSDIQSMFPIDVREKITSYNFFQRSLELLEHIEWRQTHPEEPPLIILSSTPIATSKP